MAGRIEGQHVLVTGGARGIGAAIAAKALAEGALVSIIDLDEAAGRDLLLALGAGKRASFTRRRRAARVRHRRARSRRRRKMFGPVNGLVNNAGRNVYADPVTMTEEEWEDVFAVDLKSAWLAARAVLPAMKAAKKGAIVNIASLHADMTYPGMFPYAAAKSGLVGLTRSLALEVGPMADSRQRAVAGLRRDRAGHRVLRPQRCEPAREGACRPSDAAHGQPGGNRQLRRLSAVGRSLLRHRRQLARGRRPRRPLRRVSPGSDRTF